jgi:phosphatidylserine decarboxylase
MTQLQSSNTGGLPQKWSWPAVHPEGRKFVVISAVICLAFALLAWETLAWPMAGITLWVAAFFRDPVRVSLQDADAIISPADGMVCQISKVPPPPELAGPDYLGTDPVTRVSVFMSVFDVHINRTPISGTVKAVFYIAGKFVNADLDKASEDNERQHFLVERADGVRVGFTQIAGLIARRIMTFVKPGDVLHAGDRIGLIRFGSRVDVFLPAGTEPLVLLGQRAIAGETILARIGDTQQRLGVAQ